MKTWKIYSLIDPRTGAVRYIGKADNTKRRLCVHLAEAKYSNRHNHRINWIRSLLSDNLISILIVLESGTGDVWKDSEKRWIKIFRDAGAKLVNGTDGGDGMCNPSEETRNKISLANLGKVVSCKTREKLSMASRGKVCSVQTREKIGLANSGRIASAETRARMSLVRRGKFLSPEHRVKISISNLGKPKSPEHREKIVAMNRSIEHRNKLSEMFRGRHLSEEQKRKISESRRGRRLSPEVVEKRRFKMREKRLVLENAVRQCT